MNLKNMMDGQVTRRNLLIGTGKCALGAASITAIASAAGLVVTKAEALGGSTEKWPWPYARLTASMAYQTVVLLDKWKDGKYSTAGIVPTQGYGIQSQHNCTDCHGEKVPSPPIAVK